MVLVVLRCLLLGAIWAGVEDRGRRHAALVAQYRTSIFMHGLPHMLHAWHG